jgi:hypothetical protein
MVLYGGDVSIVGQESPMLTDKVAKIEITKLNP